MTFGGCEREGDRSLNRRSPGAECQVMNGPSKVLPPKFQQKGRTDRFRVVRQTIQVSRWQLRGEPS